MFAVVGAGGKVGYCSCDCCRCWYFLCRLLLLLLVTAAAAVVAAGLVRRVRPALCKGPASSSELAAHDHVLPQPSSHESDEGLQVYVLLSFR